MATAGGRTNSSSNGLDAANQLVELVTAIVEQELNKRDTVMVCTVYSRNESDDTYNVYIEAERISGTSSVMRNIPNSTPMTFVPGDHVYVMKVRNQVAQAFIIGAAAK